MCRVSIERTDEMIIKPNELEEQIKRQIPYAKHLDFSFQSFIDQELVVKAPFESNKNDKNTGFAGSIATLSVLSGWSLVTLLVSERYANNSVAAVKTEMEYFKPVFGDFCAKARLAEVSDLEKSFSKLERKGRGRLDVSVDIFEMGVDEVKGHFEGSYFIEKL